MKHQISNEILIKNNEEYRRIGVENKTITFDTGMKHKLLDDRPERFKCTDIPIDL